MPTFYTPAISDSYSRCFRVGFLNEDDDVLRFHPYALFSAGISDLREDVYPLNSRYRKTLIGDSGGFQIARNRWKADWGNSDDKIAVEYRKKTFEWLVNNTDWFMTLDIPLAIVDEKSHIPLTTIFKGTEINLEYWYHEAKNRRFERVLNVLSGCNDWKTTVEWYNRFKWPSAPDREFFFRGYSFGGQNVKSIRRSLMVLKMLYDDGFLTKEHKWIHFLGISKLWKGWVYHAICDVLTDILDHDELTITYDSATPFVAASKGLLVLDHILQPDGKWATRFETFKPSREYVDKTAGDWVKDQGYEPSEVMYRLGLKDICSDNDGKFRWKECVYCIIMHNNLLHHIKAHDRIKKLYEEGCAPGIFRGIVRRDVSQSEWFLEEDTIKKQFKDFLYLFFTAERNTAFELARENDMIKRLSTIETYQVNVFS